MAGPGLPVNVDTTYTDSGLDPSVKAHQQHHDKIHDFVNQFDVDLVPSAGQVPTWNATAGLYQPVTPSTTGGSDDFVDANSTAFAGGMGTGRTAVQNGAALQAATIAAAGRTVTARAGNYDMAGCSLTDEDVNWYLPGVWFTQPQQLEPTATIERTPGTPMSVGATYLTWWGPWQPSGIAVSTLLQAIPATGLNRFHGGHVYRIDSRDAYPWSWSALNLYNVGDTPDYTQTDGLMWQAETFPLLGIGMLVSGISGNTGPLESMMVRGSSSLATGLVQSRLVGNASGGITATQAHITFTSVSGDFQDGETLTRIAGGNPTVPSTGIAAVGATLGTVTGLPVLLTADIFTLQYGRTSATEAVAGTKTPTRTDNTVQLREVDTGPMCRIKGLGIDVSGNRDDPDSYVPGSLRPSGIELRGVYMPEVEWRVKNAWTRAMCVWSDYMGRFDGTVEQMPNHAILDQSAFAYGMELKAGSKGTQVRLSGHTVRHLFTTNPNQRSYFQANNFASGKWAQWDYGTQFYTDVDGFHVEAAFAPAMDTHPGDYFTTFRNGRIHGGGSGGRFSTDNNSAYSSRGFGTRWVNVEVDSSAVGFNIGGVEHDAGLNHRYLLVNVRVREALAQAVFCPPAMVPGQATIVVDGGEFSMRANYQKDSAGTIEPSTAKYGVQTCFQVSDGVALELSGDVKLRKFGAAGVTMRGTGDLTIWSAAFDHTECPTSASSCRIDVGTGVVTTVNVFDLKGKGTGFAMLRNVSGNTTFNVAVGALKSLGGTLPAKVVSGGVPVWNNVAALSV